MTDTYGVSPTEEGRHIRALKITERAEVDHRQRQNQLVVATHHARELATPELALRTATKLLEEYTSSPAIKAIVDTTQTYIVWDQNPDGLAYVWSTDANWRKNRRPDAGGSYGVDLNRNYQFGWNSEFAGSTTETSQTYKGPQAGSEPETRTMLAFQADRKFAKLLDLHAYGRDVRQNYAACASLPALIDDEYSRITGTVAGAMRYDPVRSCCTGGDIATAYHDHLTMSLLVEIGTAFQPPYDQTELEIEERNWPGVLEFLSRPIPASGRITDAVSGAGIQATMTLPNVGFLYAERPASTAHGLYYLWLPPGTHDVIVEAPGHEPAQISVEAADEGVVTDIQLQPTRR